jgi:hypothetical protein
VVAETAPLPGADVEQVGLAGKNGRGINRRKGNPKGVLEEHETKREGHESLPHVTANEYVLGVAELNGDTTT